MSPCSLAQDHSARRGQLGDLVAEVAKDRDSLPRAGSSGRSRAQRTEDLRALDGEKRTGYAWTLTHAGTGGGRCICFGSGAALAQRTTRRVAPTPTCTIAYRRGAKLGHGTCHLKGYPLVRLVDPGAHAISTSN